MNKKEYDIIANVFYREMIQLSTVKQADQWRDMVSAMANALSTNYPSFNRQMFIKACQESEKGSQ